MKKVYSIAGVLISVEYKYSYTQKMFEKYEYLGSNLPEVEICVTDKEIENERSQMPNEPLFYLENLAILRKVMKVLLFDYNAMLFHGSSIKVGGKGYVFTAPSGTGKSTHTSILKEFLGDELTYINDDKPILKIEGDSVVVYGSPWNGKHCLGENISAPLDAICLIIRAENNRVEKVEPFNFLKFLFEQSMGFSDEETAEKVLEILSVIIEKIKFYKVYCNKDISAGKCSFEGIMK
ncbi:MAG: hypothetical protein E7358_01870 [Clostridiales bacterium]|nr:hypothetical protein [Clostridiales bacterium]